MGVKANVHRDAHGDIIVQMEGDLDFDLCVPLRAELQTLIKNNPTVNVTFDLGGMDFIGSSGLCHFAETIRIIKDNKNNLSTKIHVSNISPEFRKLFKLYTLEEIMEEEFEMNTDSTADLSTQFGNRRRTFEN